MKKTKEPDRGEDDSPTVVLRRRDPKMVSPSTKSAPTISSPYNFMRRSCTFVAESSLGLRKSASRNSSIDHQSAGIRTSLKNSATPTTAPQKTVKDRKNLALQVRQKKDMLEETANGESRVNGRLEEGVSGGGRMSRLVGGLRAWSSTEDVRQSFMGALGRTVSVIKQQPVSRKVKQAFTPTTRAMQKMRYAMRKVSVICQCQFSMLRLSCNHIYYYDHSEWKITTIYVCGTGTMGCRTPNEGLRL